MAAYVDHGLSLAERARVERHLASCPQCIALLAGVVRTVAEVSAAAPDAKVTAEATPRITWRAVAGALTAAAAVIAVLVLPSIVRPWLERDAGLVSLVDSVGEQRSVLGRLTGGFPHAPLGVPPAGGQGGRVAETDRVLPIAGRIRESFGDRETPSRLHALGVSQLLAGRYDDAAQSLLAASREQPGNAQYLSDVAAVHLERARLGLRPDDLPRALAAADRARRLDPSLREAWFNRALAATALSLTEHARTAWTEYLKRDSSSPWAAEARARLEELSKPTPAAAWASIEGRLQQPIDAATADEAVRTQTTEARNFIENVLFVEWANAVLGGGSGSAELERLRVMGDAMLRVAGDALYRDAVSAIDHAEARGEGTRLASIHRSFAAAAAQLSEDRFSDASVGMSKTRAEFGAMGSSFAELASLGLGTVAYVGRKYDDVERILSPVQSSADRSGYAYAKGRASWLRGMAEFARGNVGDAQARYEDSLATFEQMGDVEQAAGAHNLLSGLFYYLGDSVSEWRHRLVGLNALSVSRSMRYRYSVLAAAAISLRADYPEAALAVQEGVLTTAREWRRDAAITEVLAQKATTLLALGRMDEARKSATEARQHLEVVPDSAFRSFIELPILAVESDLFRSTDPAQAVAAAQNAIATLEKRGDRPRLAQFQLRLAKANIVWGKLEEAERAVIAGIQAFDDQRAKLVDENALSAFDESWQLFETAARLAIRRGDHERAFAMAERARATSLAEHRRTVTAISLAEAKRFVRPDQAIVALNQFDDELAVWVIRNGKATVVLRPLNRLDAQRLVSRQQEEIRVEAIRPSASAALFDEIVRPLAASLAGATHLVFVPDATFENVSLAALWDKSKSRFLIEDKTISYAPNVTILSVLSSRRRIDSSNARALVFATDESTVAAIANTYSSREIVAGAAATRKQFLEGAMDGAIVHVAVPTHPNAAYPLMSRLVFSDEPGRRHSGAVFGLEIAGRQMAATRLVVLDDVRTDRRYQPAGTFSLARAFLAAGVPAVLGTLPGATESDTRELMVGFHRHLAAQASAEDALTRLQRSALQQNGRRLGAWSALVIYGSDR